MKTWGQTAIFAWVGGGIGFVMLASAGSAQKAAVPVMYGVDSEFETWSWGEISKAAAVRIGPGAGYHKIGELKTGAGVTLFEGKGDWIGIAYGSDGMEECPPRNKNKAYDGPSKSGWVPKKFIRLLAG